MLKNLIRHLLLLALIFCQNTSWAEPAIDLVRVLKSEHRLELLSKGKVTHQFKVALGNHPIGPKRQEGDGKTPEGNYILDYKKSDSAFHHAIHISYPNHTDMISAAARGVKPGGQVMIHGQKNGLDWFESISQHFDWTNGCVALSNKDMDIVWALVKEGTKIEISP